MVNKEVKKSPVVWLAVYEAARKRGDLKLAARAKRELKKYGVVVDEKGVDHAEAE